MVQVELNNMYINIGAKSGSEKIMNKKKHRDCQSLSPHHIQNRIRVTFINF